MLTKPLGEKIVVTDYVKATSGRKQESDARTPHILSMWALTDPTRKVTDLRRQESASLHKKSLFVSRFQKKKIKKKKNRVPAPMQRVVDNLLAVTKELQKALRPGAPLAFFNYVHQFIKQSEFCPLLVGIATMEMLKWLKAGELSPSCSCQPSLASFHHLWVEEMVEAGLLENKYSLYVGSSC
ncbi:hypothetical protein PHJA_002141600 [Phtheirospermum japonicum]|uniref:Uncharacterized protein n=1 Tax=Phtheirospermum japonicum TaxID=374723 RepID=A0A830CY15_9LAMI|nr:hypothetical protein PHJA_002141600 [Phtheirospermum japonicum]